MLKVVFVCNGAKRKRVKRVGFEQLLSFHSRLFG